MKRAAYIGGVLGLILFVALIARADLGGILHTLRLGGPRLMWVLPYRLLFFILYALGWAVLLRPYDPARRLSLPFLSWVATVREGIDRLLPVASVGGAVVGVRLLGWRGLAVSAGAASVVAEVLLTLFAVGAFTLAGLALLGTEGFSRIPSAMLLGLEVGGLALPILLAVALRSGAVFARSAALLGRLLGVSALAPVAGELDAQVGKILRRAPALIGSWALQLLALMSGTFEVWFALRLFGHPIGVKGATMLESLMQAARHLAFAVPGALGVQEGALLVLGASLGVSAELALAVSLVKRMRELAWGIPALASWQWQEGRRLSGRKRPA